MNEKILLTGSTGQLGFELARSLAPLGDVVAVGRMDCDLTDGRALRRLIREVRPTVIVNPAAFTAVDKAELDQEAAYAVNADAPGIFGEEAERLGATVIHFSTDYVFDGTKSGSYRECDVAQPQSVYGTSKLLGEQTLMARCRQSVVLRTSWVLGANGGNFAKSILRIAAERDVLRVVSDQFGAPTPASLIADIGAHLVRQCTREGADAFPFGVYHLASSGETNWCEYARFVIREAVAAGSQLKVNPEDVVAITTEDYPTPAKRPRNSRLDTSLLKSTFGLQLPDWQEGVRRTLKQIL